MAEKIMDREKKIELVQKIVDFRGEIDECIRQFVDLFGSIPSVDEGGVFQVLSDFLTIK